MKFRLIASLCAFSLITVAASATNLVTNGTFTPDNSGNGYGAVSGWTQTNYPSGLGGFDYLTGSNVAGQPFYNNGSAPAATVGFIQVFHQITTDGLFQSLTLDPGTYELSFYEDARSGTDSPSVDVTFGSQIISPLIVDTPGSFVHIIDVFTTTGGTENLSFNVFEPGTDSDATALITDVSVVATPEPSSLVLLGTGLIGAAGVARRKFRRA